jgi:hypothetical protein
VRALEADAAACCYALRLEALRDATARDRASSEALVLHGRASGATVDQAATYQLLGLIDDEVGDYATGMDHFARARHPGARGASRRPGDAHRAQRSRRHLPGERRLV